MPKTVIVTGAGSGIGRALALGLGQAGWRVLALGRRPAPLESLVSEATGAVVPLVCDLAAADLEPRLEPWVGEVDAVVHAAATFPPYAPAERSEPADLEQAWRVGVAALQVLARLALPGMKRRGFGRFVVLGSVAATLGGQGQSIYNAVKAAQLGWLRTLAAEAGRHGVTANAIELGLIDTPRLREVVAPAVLEALLARTPAGRLGTAEEVVALVGFLVSPAASFLTGASVPLAGGLGLGLLARPTGGTRTLSE